MLTRGYTFTIVLRYFTNSLITFTVLLSFSFDKLMATFNKS